MNAKRPPNEDEDGLAQSSHARKLWAWVILQALIPAFVVVLTWLAAAHLFNVDFAFQKTFIGADLVLVGSLLLMTLIIDIWAEQRQLNASKGMLSLDRLWIVSAGFTFLAVMCFGFLKVKALQYDFPQRGAAVDPSIDMCIGANIVFGLFAIIWGAAVAVFAHRKFLEAELLRLQ
jgi:hypothetical protein